MLGISPDPRDLDFCLSGELLSVEVLCQPQSTMSMPVIMIMTQEPKIGAGPPALGFAAS